MILFPYKFVYMEKKETFLTQNDNINNNFTFSNVQTEVRDGFRVVNAKK